MSGMPQFELSKFKIFNDHDSLPKLLVYCASFGFVLAMQVGSLMLYVLFLFLIAPMTFFWLVCGFFFYHSKLMSMSGIWNMWFSTWSNSDEHFLSAEIDSSLLNEALLVEFLFLSVPSLIIQITNNSIVKDNWMYFSWISFALSVSSFINGISRYGYYVYVKGTFSPNP